MTVLPTSASFCQTCNAHQQLLLSLQVKDYAAELVEPNCAPLSGILQPEDEIRLWTDLAASHTCPRPLQDRAAAIASILAPVQPKLRKLQKTCKDLSEEEMIDLIDDLHHTLDALWELEAPTVPGVIGHNINSKLGKYGNINSHVEKTSKNCSASVQD